MVVVEDGRDVDSSEYFGFVSLDLVFVMFLLSSEFSSCPDWVCREVWSQDRSDVGDDTVEDKIGVGFEVSSGHRDVSE